MEQVSSVVHAIRILSCFTEATPELRLVDVSRLVGLSTSQSHRLLTILTDEGLLRRAPNSSRYRLGLRLFQLGQLAAGELTARLIRPPMEELAQATGETVLLGVRDGYELIFLQEIDSPEVLRVSPGLMYRSPILATATGQALLAWAPEVEIDAAIRHRTGESGWTANQSAEYLWELLSEARRAGYAVSERDRAIRAIAAPIRDEHDLVIAAVTVAAPAIRLPLAQVPTVAKQVMRTAQALSGQSATTAANVVRGRPALAESLFRP